MQNLKCARYTIILFNLFNVFHNGKCVDFVFVVFFAEGVKQKTKHKNKNQKRVLREIHWSSVPESSTADASGNCHETS